MTMDETDFLTFHLYAASKTPRIRKARLRSWILTTVALFCLGYLFYDNENDFLGDYFLILGVVSLVLFPFYSRWRYKRHYRRFVRDTYKNKFGEKCDLQVDDQTIGTKDKSGEVKINKTEIEEINEIKDYYFLKARTGATLIVSKDKSDDLDEINNLIKSLVETYGVKHNVELDWKWR